MLKYIKQLIWGKKRTEEMFLSEQLLLDKKIETEDLGKNKEVPESENAIEVVTDNVNLIKEDKIISTEKTAALYDPALDLRDYEYPNIHLLNEEYRDPIQQFLNRDFEGELPVIWSADKEKIIIKDLAELKNILIAGTQATGKTTFIRQILISLLFITHPSKLKLVLIDTKGVEFSSYLSLENFFLARLPGEENSIVQDYKKVIHTLNALCIEMDNRYNLLVDAKARNIKEYNNKFFKGELNLDKGHQFLPFIVFIIDDLSACTFSKDEINPPIQKLVNDGYKAGIYSIISTSQFIGDVMTGNLFSMIHARVVFRLNSRADYRKFLDTAKVDKNLKDGEFLYYNDFRVVKGNSILFNFHNIDSVIQFISNQRGYPQAFLLPEYVDEKEMESKDFDSSSRDPLFEDAARLIVSSQIGSTSLIQRRMKLGYNRAGRLMDQLEAAGIVGPNQGSKARDVQVRTDMELEEILGAY